MHTIKSKRPGKNRPPAVGSCIANLKHLLFQIESPSVLLSREDANVLLQITEVREC
jgi:hypothetical protein